MPLLGGGSITVDGGPRGTKSVRAVSCGGVCVQRKGDSDLRASGAGILRAVNANSRVTESFPTILGKRCSVPMSAASPMATCRGTRRRREALGDKRRLRQHKDRALTRRPLLRTPVAVKYRNRFTIERETGVGCAVPSTSLLQHQLTAPIRACV